jgi:endonuclease-3 related protein
MSASIGSARAPLARWRRIPGPPRDRVKARLLRLYGALARRFGPQHWWPGRTPYEIAAGAVLTQHTAWANAARAVAALRARGLLTAPRLARLSAAALARVIRPAGTPRVKARRLLALTRWLLQAGGGGFTALRTRPLGPLRRRLLAVRGLGPETADAILLYAANRPVFVADAYARRVLARHRLLAPRAGYEAARAFVEAHLPSDPALFNEYHALLVAVGKSHCRTVPRCATCPLRFDLRGRAPAR